MTTDKPVIKPWEIEREPAPVVSRNMTRQEARAHLVRKLKVKMQRIYDPSYTRKPEGECPEVDLSVRG